MSPAPCDQNPSVHERLGVLEHRMDDVQPKIDEMHAIMLQTRGASRLGRAIAGVLGALGLGGLAAHKWPAFLAWLGS